MSVTRAARHLRRKGARAMVPNLPFPFLWAI